MSGRTSYCWDSCIAVPMSDVTGVMSWFIPKVMYIVMYCMGIVFGDVTQVPLEASKVPHGDCFHLYTIDRSVDT